MIDLLFLQVVGAVFLLLYAIRLTGQGFELAFSSAFDKAWSSAGGSRARAFAAGVAGTALLQSSGALVTLVISFAHVATLPLARSLGIVLGADIGSTLTVQVLSFRVHQFAFPVLSAGVFLYLWGRKGKVRAIGQGILGFGFMLLALRFLSEAAGDAGRIDGLRTLMAQLQDSPFTGFVLGALLAALFQSGTAVLILLIAFAKEGILAAPAVLPLVLGANVGGPRSLSSPRRASPRRGNASPGDTWPSRRPGRCCSSPFSPRLSGSSPHFPAMVRTWWRTRTRCSIFPWRSSFSRWWTGSLPC